MWEGLVPSQPLYHPIPVPFVLCTIPFLCVHILSYHISLVPYDLPLGGSRIKLSFVHFEYSDFPSLKEFISSLMIYRITEHSWHLSFVPFLPSDTHSVVVLLCTCAISPLSHFVSSSSAITILCLRPLRLRLRLRCDIFALQRLLYFLQCAPCCDVLCHISLALYVSCKIYPMNHVPFAVKITCDVS